MIAMPPFSTGNCVCMGLFSFHVFSQLGGPVCGSVFENCVCMRLLFRAMRSRSSAVRFAASTPGGRGILARVVCRCSRCLCLSQRRPKRRLFLSATTLTGRRLRRSGTRTTMIVRFRLSQLTGPFPTDALNVIEKILCGRKPAGANSCSPISSAMKWR